MIRIRDIDPEFQDRITVTTAARILEVSGARIIELERLGTLKDVLRTPLGRLFSRPEVESLRATRDAKKAAAR